MPALIKLHRCFVAAALVASTVACLAHAQQPPAEPEEVLRVTTELVQTDVAVFDKGGKFVDNLKADQFELRVDGRAQPISFFERVVAGSYDEDAQLAAARGASRSGAAGRGAPAVPLDRGRAIAFFIDDLHLSPASVARTRTLLTRFIEEQLRQNDQMLVTTASNQVGFLQQPTDDKAVLRAAVARLGTREINTQDPERPRINIAQAIAIEQNDPTVLDYFVEQTLKENPAFGADLETARRQAAEHVRRRAAALIDSSAFVAARTIDGLRALVRLLAAQPGRKLVYFVSDGFAAESMRSGMNERLRLLTDAAVRAGAVIYTVDARALGAQLADLPQAADDSSPDLAGRLTGVASMTQTMQEPLRVIAGETGGRALLNTNALEEAVSGALKETSVYYLLAWRPEREENRGGKFRRIEVRVTDRPDLTVLVQRGYYVTPPPEPTARSASSKREAAPLAPERDELFAALRAPFPRIALPVALTTNYLLLREGVTLLAASVKVELEASRRAESGALPVDRAEVIGAVYNDQGKVVSTFNRTVSITPNAPDVDAPLTHNVTLSFQTPIAPGLYQVRVAGRDPKNRRTGSAVQWVEVPDLAGGAFSLSSVFLGVAPAAEPAQASAPTPQVAPQLIVKADRRFARDTPLRFLVYFYNAKVTADGRPDVVLQLQILRDDQPVVTTPLRKVEADGLTDFKRIPYMAELSLTGLPAGRYIFMVTAIDRAAKATAKRNAKFIIE